MSVDPRPPLEALDDSDHAGDERGERGPIGAHVRRMHSHDSRVGNGAPSTASSGAD